MSKIKIGRNEPFHVEAEKNIKNVAVNDFEFHYYYHFQKRKIPYYIQSNIIRIDTYLVLQQNKSINKTNIFII